MQFMYASTLFAFKQLCKKIIENLLYYYNVIQYLQMYNTISNISVFFPKQDCIIKASRI